MTGKRRSFTVLELVFAVAITSLLTLAALRICSQSLDVVDTLVDAHYLHNKAKKVFNYLEADLKNLSFKHEGEYAEAVMEYAPDSVAHKMKNEQGENMTDNYSNRGLYLISQVAGQDGKLRKALVHYRLTRNGQNKGPYTLGLSRSVLGSNAFVQHNGKGGIPKTGMSCRIFFGLPRAGSVPYFPEEWLQKQLKRLAALSHMIVFRINPDEGSLSLKGRLNSQKAFSQIAGIPQQTVYSQRQKKRVAFNQTWFEDTENVIAFNVLDLEIEPIINTGYLGLKQIDLVKDLSFFKWIALSSCESAQGSGPPFLVIQAIPAPLKPIEELDKIKKKKKVSNNEGVGATARMINRHVGIFLSLGWAKKSSLLTINAELSPMKHATTAWEKQQSYDSVIAIEKISHFKIKLTLINSQHIKKLNDPNLKMDFETFKQIYGITFHKNILAQN